MTTRIEKALYDTEIETPCLILDRERIKQNYKNFCRKMKGIDVFYAVKANPHPEVLKLLTIEGANFDCASFREIELALAAGCKPEKISFGNTLKKALDITNAYEAGISHFVFDAKEELHKIAKHAPNSRVTCRILVNSDGDGAQWPLSRKFGCDEAMAIELMIEALELGLVPSGISFHVGSQQTETSAWDAPIKQVTTIFKRLAELGINLEEINLGGGFPTAFGDIKVPKTSDFTRVIKQSLKTCFGSDLPRVVVEPGRALVGDAGIIVSEVVLVSKKSATDTERWVYLDVGRFHGLAETEGEAIRYKLSVPSREGTPHSPAIIAGPTCDAVDTLYELNPVNMPIGLIAGDRVLLHDTGAYTATYSSVGFNGLGPLQVCLLDDLKKTKLKVLKAK